MNHRSGRALGMTVAAASVGLIGLAGLVGCAGDSGRPLDGPAPASRSSAVPGHVAAYRAGYTAGKAVYDASGKGAAVRETVWGGCTRRAPEAGSAAETDRGAWVRGCLNGVANAPERLPTSHVTQRTTDATMLDRFRTWARTKGEGQGVEHVRMLTIAQLTEHDYDVELNTDYPAGPSGDPGAETLAQSFVEWWDGDHGRDGTARNVLILGADGTRLSARRI